MPFFSEDWVQELLSKVNLVDLVGEYVTLQNKSGRWWACCPFHNEKTPSFSVNPEKGFYHCFGCGKGGDAIRFVMEQEKMTFPEACRYLADKVKLPVPETGDNSNYEKRKQQREKIHAMNKIAALFFHRNLFSPAGASALSYLHERGIGDKVIKTFGIGYALDSWDSLMKLLQKEGYTKQDMQTAGLIKINDSKSYDMFRNRVIIPIINTFSDVIGFGGRVMDDSLPKYLNSPETAAFNKSRNLYNLNLIRRQKGLSHLILVEGYMDVIALCSYGIPECVATLGTALTQDQARLIRKYTANVYVSYDGDEAGKKATLRALDILAREGIETRVVSIPGGQDPDEFLKQYGKAGYVKLMKASMPALDYKFHVIAQKYDLDDGYQKEKFAHECIALLKTVDSAVVREEYTKKLSRITGFSENAIAQDAGTVQGEDASWSPPAVKVTEEADVKTENDMIRLLLDRPRRILKLEGKLETADFTHPVNKKVFSFILNKAKEGDLVPDGEILNVLSEQSFEAEEERSHITWLANRTDAVDGSDDFFAACARKLRLYRMDRELKAANAAYEKETDAAKKQLLADRIVGLTKGIHKLKTSF